MSSAEAPPEEPGAAVRKPVGAGAHAGRRARPVVTVVVLAAVAVAAVGVSRLGGDPAPKAARPTLPSGPLASSRAAATEAVLRRQADSLANRDRTSYLAVWDRSDAARHLATLTYTNLLRLGVTRISPRLSLETVRDAGSTWTAQVDVTWGLRGLGSATATSALRYTFADVAGHDLISTVAAVPGDREPVWLLPSLDVRQGPRTLVVATNPESAVRVERLLRQAVTAVGEVLPRWHGDLVAYAPGSASQFAALIAASPGQYRGIAAVTTTVDGSPDASAATAIVVNPPVFDGLGPVGAHVVVTHEATHVATHAAAVSMPLWVAEGFADYVGIGSVDLPVAVAAKAALHVVRREGPPDALPDDAAFTLDGAGLEATYEEAWLATSLIARTYGQQRLVAFYRTVETHPDDLARAFERILHTSVPVFTAAWRSYLQESAGAG